MIFDFILHVDKHLINLVEMFGPFTYLILFLVIFVETGFVIMPFLPGDSLLFVIGTFASQGVFNIFLMGGLLIIAAILGDSLNYYIGSYLGENAFEKSRFFKKEYLNKTKKFYEKHGGTTIFLGRFIPIVRTFAPFIAGVGKMDYKKFLTFNITGAICWVSLFLTAGYFFGSIPIVEENLSLILLGIVILSVIPIMIEYFGINRYIK